MTREEAIKLIDTHTVCFYNEIDSPTLQALHLAIEALTEPKTIIGIDIPYGSDKGIATVFKGKNDKLILEEVKEIMSVVRCKDCEHHFFDKGNDAWFCHEHEYGEMFNDNDFCSWAKMKGGAE